MIRIIEKSDREAYLALTEAFYKTPAVDHEIPEENRIRTFEYLMTRPSDAECVMIECDGECAGYALFAKTFSQEAGGVAVWFEEIYIKEEFRGKGLGHEVFEFAEKHFPEARRFRLEVEDENVGAVKLYKSLGFDYLPYKQMIKDK